MARILLLVLRQSKIQKILMNTKVHHQRVAIVVTHPVPHLLAVRVRSQKQINLAKEAGKRHIFQKEY